ncbi:YjfB family protein [Bacillus tianshenii]|nr:YjfB family protein [Bacillus tianshenii]
MNVAGASMAMSQMNANSQVDVALKKKTMNVAEQQGNAMVEMMQKSAPHPTSGHNIDIKG